MNILKTDCQTTKCVKTDYNILSELEFLNKYYCSKYVYLKRVLKYSDPYMNAPLAKIGKILKHLFN